MLVLTHVYMLCIVFVKVVNISMKPGYGIMDSFNPFTAPACNISGLKDAGTCLQIVYIFWSFNTTTFNVIICFDENPFTFQCEKEDKKA